MVIKKYTLQFEALALCSLPHTYKQLWPCQRYRARVYIFCSKNFVNSKNLLISFAHWTQFTNIGSNWKKNSMLVKIYTTCREGLSWPWSHVHHKHVSVGQLLELIRLLPLPAQRYIFSLPQPAQRYISFLFLGLSTFTFIEQARAWREGRLAKLPCSSSPCQQYWSCGSVCYLSIHFQLYKPWNN